MTTTSEPTILGSLMKRAVLQVDLFFTTAGGMTVLAAGGVAVVMFGLLIKTLVKNHQAMLKRNELLLHNHRVMQERAAVIQSRLASANYMLHRSVGGELNGGVSQSSHIPR